MTSSAQVNANRKNAKRSTGPRTKVGKQIAARNAIRHGLAIPAGAIEELAPAIARLTAILAGPTASAERLMLARNVAEAEIEIIRSRRARVGVLEAPFFEKPPRPRQIISAACKATKPRADWYTKGQFWRLYWQLTYRPCMKLDDNEHFAAVIKKRFSEIQRIERYERRALSRRKQAIRALNKLG